METVIIDYNCGNINSVAKTVAKLGVRPAVTVNPRHILNAKRLILPGVGHFGQAMQQLKKLHLIEPLNEAVLQKKIPVLGICLGMQLMTNESEEGQTAGLGWINATCKKFNPDNKKIFKVPNIGWRTVKIAKASALMNNIAATDEFYFVHAYHCICTNTSDVLNTAEYETSFTAAFAKDNIYGLQYHPEKSHGAGMQLVKNFILG